MKPPLEESIVEKWRKNAPNGHFWSHFCSFFFQCLSRFELSFILFGIERIETDNKNRQTKKSGELSGGFRNRLIST